MEKTGVVIYYNTAVGITDLTVKAAVVCTIHIYIFGAFILNSSSIYNTQTQTFRLCYTEFQ